MSTVTAHTLLRRAARCSAGATSLAGCPKPAGLSLPFAPNSGSGKKNTTRRRFVCNYTDPTKPEHPSKIPTGALLMHEPTPTATEFWEVKKVDTTAKLTLLKIPGDPKPADFEVTVEGDVLEISKKPGAAADKTSFNVRLQLPEFYVREEITAELDPRNKPPNLVVTIPKRYKKGIEVKEMI